MKLSPAQKIKQIILRESLGKVLVEPSEVESAFNDRYKDIRDVMSEGKFVGWIFCFARGSSIPWIEDAYEVEMTEETCVVKVFKKVAPAEVAK